MININIIKRYQSWFSTLILSLHEFDRTTTTQRLFSFRFFFYFTFFSHWLTFTLLRLLSDPLEHPHNMHTPTGTTTCRLTFYSHNTNTQKKTTTKQTTLYDLIWYKHMKSTTTKIIIQLNSTLLSKTKTKKFTCSLMKYINIDLFVWFPAILKVLNKHKTSFFFTSFLSFYSLLFLY